jgi:4'-phosphopantetheinyl transferase EntD
VIGSLFPEGVVTVCATPEMEGEPLHPEESARVQRMGEKRRREYALGRACARRALAQLGIEGFALLSGEKREPLWPDGVVGSLTHCRGFCAAAVAPRGAVVGIGLDAEPAAPLAARLLERVCSSEEKARLEALPSPGACGWGVVLFSAKESLYKCYFPLTRSFLGFRDAEIQLDPDTSSFTARLLRDAAPSALGARSFRGRFRADGDHLVTAVTLTAADCDATPPSAGTGAGTLLNS